MPITPDNPFKGRHYSGEVILLAVRWYLRYPVWSKNPICLNSKDDGGRGPGVPNRGVTPRYITKESPLNVDGTLETSLPRSWFSARLSFWTIRGRAILH